MSKHAFPSRTFSAVVPSIVVRGDGARSPLDTVKAGGSRISRMERGTGLSKHVRAEPSDINPETPYVDPLNVALMADMRDMARAVKHHAKTADAHLKNAPVLRDKSGKIVQTWAEKCKAQDRSIEPARKSPTRTVHNTMSAASMRIALERRAAALREFRLSHKAKD